MRKEHPFRRAFWLALVMVVLMVAVGTPSLYEVFDGRNLTREMLAFVVMMAVGAFLAAIPSRIRRGSAAHLTSTWPNCVLNFVCGVALLLGARLADGGDMRMLAGAMQGSVGALVFMVCAWVTALVAGRLAERRKA